MELNLNSPHPTLLSTDGKKQLYFILFLIKYPNEYTSHAIALRFKVSKTVSTTELNNCLSFTCCLLFDIFCIAEKN